MKFQKWITKLFEFSLQFLDMWIKLNLETTLISMMMKFSVFVSFQHCNIFKLQHGPWIFWITYLPLPKFLLVLCQTSVTWGKNTNIQQILLKFFFLSLQNLGQMKQDTFKSLGKLLKESAHQFIRFFRNREVLICQSIPFVNNLVLFLFFWVAIAEKMLICAYHWELYSFLVTDTQWMKIQHLYHDVTKNYKQWYSLTSMLSRVLCTLTFHILVQLLVSLVHCHSRKWIPCSTNNKAAIPFKFWVNATVVLAKTFHIIMVDC